VRWLIRLITLSLLLIPIGLVVLAAMCIESSPMVEAEIRLSAANIDRAKRLLHEHDPRKLRTGEIKTVRMSEEELNLVLNHLINRLGPGGATLDMNEGWLSFAATLDLSKVVPGRYLNVATRIDTDAGKARIEQLKIGPVEFPRGIVAAVTTFVAEHIYRASGVHNAEEVIRAIAIQPQRLAVTYQWKEGIVDALRDRIVSAGDRAKLDVYNRFLASEVDRQGTRLSFASLIEAMFRLARERSADDEAVAENRAAIMVLAAYVSGSSLAALVPEAAQWVKPRRVRMRIHGRHDFVQHFTTSAALAVAAGGAMSNAIGLYKEIDDADGGSGFSFKDLTADKAGAQFGQAAVASGSSASRLQRRIGNGIDDAALVPEVGGLEENMSDAEFQRRYGGVGGAKYELVVQEIDNRIGRSPLYR